MDKIRLKLSFLNYIFHYDVVVFIFLFGMFLLIEGWLYGFEDQTRPDWNQFPTLQFSISLITLGLWGFYKQYKRLFFRTIPLEYISKEEGIRIAKEIFTSYGWWVIKEKEETLVAEGANFRNNFLSFRTYRNRITLLFDEENLYINCIVEPPLNGQFVTFGKMNQLYEDFTNLFLDGVFYLVKDKNKMSTPNNG